MSESPDGGDLRGKVCRMVVERQRNGYLLTVWPMRREATVTRNGGVAEFTGGEEYVAVDRDDLADLVRRLVAEPPEGRAR